MIHRCLSRAAFVVVGVVSATAAADAVRIDPTALATEVLIGLADVGVVQDDATVDASADAKEPLASAVPSAEVPVPALSAANSRDLSVDAFAAFDFHGTTLAVVDVGANWCIADGLSVGVFAEVVSATQEGEDAWGGGGGGLVRWDFIRRERCTVFVDVGCGLLASTGAIPAVGSDFNFTPRAMLGTTMRLDDGVLLDARVGWFHVSNAQTGETNPGLDTLAVGLGLSFEF